MPNWWQKALMFLGYLIISDLGIPLILLGFCIYYFVKEGFK